MILGKSNHPVEIKRVNVKVWTLRDEIEQALINLRANCKDDEEFKNRFEEVRETYKKGPRELSKAQDDQDHMDGSIDSPADEMDDDMAAMAAALDEEADQQEVDEHMAKVGETEDGETSEEDSQKDSESVDASKIPVEFKRATPGDDKCASGFSFLSDINMDNILFFSKQDYTIGQSIVIEFLIPLRFTLSAQVKYSHRYSTTSRIISDTKPDYRVIADFTFIHDGERTNLREFLKSIEPDIPDPPKSSSSEDDDDDDDLSDFGF